jgi:molybdate transport system substrate-binding protein
MLARQIRNGAPFDVYLSANEQFVKELDSAGLLLPGSIRSYATGRIGLWSSAGTVKSLQDLRSPNVTRIAIPNPQHAPYGMAAEQLLRKLNLWDKLKAKVVLAENVRQAFEFARTGNADAVITSWTLLHDKGGLLLPDNLHLPIRQAAGIVKTTANPKAAKAFLDFLTSPEGRQLLARYGLFP